MSADDLDRHWMERALELAERGAGRVSPNPVVGAVVVADGELVGEGWHEEFGGPHAEVLALRRAGGRAAGSTLFVSLEPCAHHGKTPPCTDAIRAAGVATVVFATRDPDPAAGGGGAVLRDAGIAVREGVCAERARGVNAAFLWRHATGRPFVVLKLATSIDGRIAAEAGTRTGLTGSVAEARTMRLRAECDALLVGAGTVRVDDPLLTVRGAEVSSRRPPVRVVLDPRAGIETGASLLRTAGEAPVLVLVAPDADPRRVEGLRAAGAEVAAIRRAASGGLELGDVLGELFRRGLFGVLCEGGGRLAGQLVAGGFVQRLHVLVAPAILGPQGVPAFGRPGPAGVWRLAGCEALGADALVTWESEELRTRTGAI